MLPFDYERPRSIDATVAALREGARPLAGGQSLLASMKLGLSAPERLLDLAGLDGLRRIEVGPDGVTVGAMATHTEVATHAGVQQAIPALADLAGRIGDRQVRNRGTLGGSLANNDPAACYPAAVLGLGATVLTTAREIAADDFFTGLYATALAEDELVTAVRFPRPTQAAWQKFRQPASRFALVGVFVSKGPQGVRVAVTGAYASVTRMAALEAALAASWTPAAAEAVKVSADGLNTDLHGSAAYRAALIPVLTARAVAAS